MAVMVNWGEGGSVRSCQCQRKTSIIFTSMASAYESSYKRRTKTRDTLIKDSEVPRRFVEI